MMLRFTDYSSLRDSGPAYGHERRGWRSDLALSSTGASLILAKYGQARLRVYMCQAALPLAVVPRSQVGLTANCKTSGSGRREGL